jgi:exportin-2 (importin alpha re-exporter)
MKQIEADKLPGILGVFQKQLASKVNDNHGFALIDTLLLYTPPEMFSTYTQQIFILMFQRLQSSKTTKYVKCLLVFFCLYAIKYGAASLVEVIDKIQAKMFGMVVEKLLIADLQKTSGQIDRKICAVGVTKILTEAPAMLQPDYIKFWPQLLQTLIGLFELPRDDTATGDEIPHGGEVENDTTGFQAAYSHLAFAGKVERDPCTDIPDVKIFLAKCLQVLCAAHPNMVKTMISSGLQAEALTFLQQYLQAAGIQLA